MTEFPSQGKSTVIIMADGIPGGISSHTWVRSLAIQPMAHFVVDLALKELRINEKGILREALRCQNRLKYDGIINEPDAEVVESLLKKGLLSRDKTAHRNGYYEHFRLTKKGRRLASTLTALERVV